MLINPRRRKHRRRKKARATRKRRYHATRNPANPHRRKRRHHRRAKRRHNPRAARAFTFAGVNLGAIGLGAAGYIGAEIGAGYLAKLLPPEWSAQPLSKTAIKAAVGFGVPILAKRFKLGSGAMWNAVMIGAGVSVAVDLLNAYVLPAIGLSDYESGQLYDYEQGQLAGPSQLAGPEDGGEAYGNSAYAAY